MGNSKIRFKLKFLQNILCPWINWFIKVNLRVKCCKHSMCTLRNKTCGKIVLVLLMIFDIRNVDINNGINFGGKSWEMT
jgi:hypothetical protein